MKQQGTLLLVLVIISGLTIHRSYAATVSISPSATTMQLGQRLARLYTTGVIADPTSADLRQTERRFENPNGLTTRSLGFFLATNVTQSTITTRHDYPPRDCAKRTVIESCDGLVQGVFVERNSVSEYYISVSGFDGVLVPSTATVDFSGVTSFWSLEPEFGTDNQGMPVMIYQNVSEGGSFAARAFAECAAFAYSASLYPDTVAVVTGMSETNSRYIWPRMTRDNDGANWLLHCLGFEENNFDTTRIRSLVYWRSQNNSINPQSTIATMIDSVSLLAATIVQNPNNDNVAIVYAKPRQYSEPRLYYNDDLYYKQSVDLGASWSSPQRIYHFRSTQDSIGSYFERANEVAALYTFDYCLHVGFTSWWVDTSSTLGLVYPSRLRHWDNCSDVTTIIDEAYWSASSCNLGSGMIYQNLAQLSLTQCNSNGHLYAIYQKSYSREDEAFYPDYRDCSVQGRANYEIVAKASSTGGITWGPDSNLTRTYSDNCTATSSSASQCQSDILLGTPERVASKLRIHYIVDHDPGVQRFAITPGFETDNKVRFLSVDCFAMATYVELRAKPASIGYPEFRTSPSGLLDSAAITLTNWGNVTATYATNSNPTWLAFGAYAGGAAPSGSVPAGVTNTETIGIRATGTSLPEGFYSHNIVFTYDSGAKTLTVKVDLYNFTNFYLPVALDIRTAALRMNVNQTSETGQNVDKKRFSYFADFATADSGGYLYDGFLIMGTSAANLTYSTALDINGTGINFPTVGNPFGFLYAATASMTGDSLSNPLLRTATGKGYNRDSTLQFDVDWYASKIPGDSSNCLVGRFKIYKGPKPGAVTGLTVAYYCDWDVPSDTGSDNVSGTDPTRFMVYQRGAYTASRQNRFAALGGVVEGGSIRGGFVVDNPTYIYPFSGFENDSLWNRLSGIAAGEYENSAFPDPGAGTIVNAEDLSSVIVLAVNQTIATAADTLYVAVVLAGQPTSGGTLVGLRNAISAGYAIICNRNLIPNNGGCCKCGDADNNGSWNIADAIYIISYLYSGGQAPAQTCLGDANGSGWVELCDAVYLIEYIFLFGPPPVCANPSAVEVETVQDYRFTYQSLFPANSTSFTVPIYRDFVQVVHGAGFHARVRVGGQIPSITAVQITPIPEAFTSGARIESAPNAEVSFELTSSLGIPAGCALYGNITLSMAAQPTNRPILLELIDHPTPLVCISGSQRVTPDLVGSPTPECGSGTLCQNSFSDPVLRLCPGGDEVFKVYLRDPAGNPIAGDSTVYISFSGNCSGVTRCPPGGSLGNIYPIAPSNAAGELWFYAPACGGCNTACYANVQAPCGLIATVPVRGYDISGDFSVALANDFNYTECNNYDGVPGVQFADQDAFYAHIGHNCNLDPCDRFNAEFVLSPATNLSPGQVVNMKVILRNNNFQSCYIGFISFLSSGFGTGTADSLISTYNYGKSIPAGGVDSVSVPYKIPGTGHGCVSAQFNSSCCGTLTILEQCAIAAQHCPSAGSTCYEFHVALNGQTVSKIVIHEDYIADGWLYWPVHIPNSFPLLPPDSIVYRICTPSSGDIGDDSRVPVEVWYDAAGTNVEVFESQVFITPRTGDANGDCTVSIADVVYLINYIFAGGSAPRPCQAGDVDCTGSVSIADAVFIINYIFSSGPPPCVPEAGTPEPNCG